MLLRNIKKLVVDLTSLITLKSPIFFQGATTLIVLNVAAKMVRIKRPILVQWNPPKKWVLNLNIDGVSKGSPGQLGCGGVTKDSNCNLIFAFSKYLGGI